LSLTAPTEGSPSLTVPDALRTVFPEAESFIRRTLFLDGGEIARIATLSGTPVSGISPLIIRHDAIRENKHIGSAYLDTHRVRTRNQTVMILIDPHGTIRRIMVLANEELPDYHAGGAWLARFSGRAMDKNGRVDPVDAIAGASFTSRAITAATRRVLALHAVTGKRK
jgi:hypothetical protein